MKHLLALFCGLAITANTMSMAQTGSDLTAPVLPLPSLTTLPLSNSPVLKGSVIQAAQPYRVGAGDVLAVHVYNQAEFTQPEVLVAPDGTATFNTVGTMYVAGKSMPEIQEMLRLALSEYVKTPKVSISMSRTRPGILYVAGAVIRPGTIQMVTDPKSLTGGAGGQSNGFRSELRLTNALAAAGGLLSSADLSQIIIHRADSGQEQTVDLWKLLRDGDNAQDVLLYQGDSIKVAELTNAASMLDEDFKILVRSSVGPGTFPVRIIGYVIRPGVYEVNGVSPYLNTAIARAEGYAVGANRKLIAIRRFTTNHNFTTLFVQPEKLDVALRPNDIIWVAERRAYATGRFFGQLSNVFSPFTNVATSAALVITTGRNR